MNNGFEKIKRVQKLVGFKTLHETQKFLSKHNISASKVLEFFRIYAVPLDNIQRISEAEFNRFLHTQRLKRYTKTNSYTVFNRVLGFLEDCPLVYVNSVKTFDVWFYERIDQPATIFINYTLPAKFKKWVYGLVQAARRTCRKNAASGKIVVDQVNSPSERGGANFKSIVIYREGNHVPVDDGIGSDGVVNGVL